MPLHSLPDVVALISQGNGMGKSLSAHYLRDKYGYTVLSFAKPLKDMLESMFNSMGFTAGQSASMIYGSEKELPIPGLALDLQPTPRQLMISLGTGWGRDQVYPLLWCDLIKTKMTSLLATNKRVVIDDTRFMNEAQMLDFVTEEMCLFIELKRDIVVDPLAQVGDLDVPFVTNVVIENDDTVAELYSCLDVAMYNYAEHFGLR